jgi:Lysylphosphatidylglycerol synthase TM region
VLRAHLIGYVRNAAFPARLGEAARAGVVARAANGAFGAILGAVLLERLDDLVALAVLVPALVVNVAAVTIAIGIAAWVRRGGRQAMTG